MNDNEKAPTHLLEVLCEVLDIKGLLDDGTVTEDVNGVKKVDEDTNEENENPEVLVTIGNVRYEDIDFVLLDEYVVSDVGGGEGFVWLNPLEDIEAFGTGLTVTVIIDVLDGTKKLSEKMKLEAEEPSPDEDCCELLRSLQDEAMYFSKMS